MILEVITGYREYLMPHVLDRAGLTAALIVDDPDATIPYARWIGDGFWYHGFLYDGDTERLTALFFEYLQDTTAPDATPTVILPFESYSDPLSRGTTPGDRRVRQFLAAAQAELGGSNVRWRRLFAADNTQRVLDRLAQVAHDEHGARPPALRATAIADRMPAETRATLERNYSIAVLRLAEKIVARRSVFTVERVGQLDAMLDHNHMRIRSDLDADRILAELEPHGELFHLLTRPVPPATERVIERASPTTAPAES